MYGVVLDSAVRARDNWVSGSGVWANDDFFPVWCCFVDEAGDLLLADVFEDGLRFAPGFEVVSSSSVALGVTSGSTVGPVIVSGCVTSSEVVSSSAVGSGDWLSC